MQLFTIFSQKILWPNVYLIVEVRLAEVSCVSLADRRGYLTMLVCSPNTANCWLSCTPLYRW